MILFRNADCLVDRKIVKYELWGLFQLGAKQEINLLEPKFKQESVTFMPPDKEVKINNIKPFPVNWT